MMESFYFGVAPRQLFGVYHAPDAGTACAAGAVLCYPMGQEYIRSHRAFLQLAGLLAARGLHVLRFDYSCSGDSAGDCLRAGLERWIEDINVAVDELKAGGASRIGVIGLRLGAALAALSAARRSDIEAAALWKPVVSGSAYLAELQALHALWLRGSFARPQDDPARQQTDEVLGFPLSAALRSELEAIDLLALSARPAHRVLVLETGHGPESRCLHDHFLNLGIESCYRNIPWPEIWIKRADETGKGPVPLPALQYIADWTCGVLR